VSHLLCHTFHLPKITSNKLDKNGLLAIRKKNILSSTYYKMYEGWNFNSGNYLFTTDTK